MKGRYFILAVALSVLGAAILRAEAEGVDAPSSQPAVAAGGGETVLIPLAGEVDDYNRDALFRRFEKARKLGAKTVILEIDTYGGRVTSGMDISRFLKRQDDLHVVAFVKDKAISAGALIALACDEIVMAPSATLGDCAPIVFDTGGHLEPLPAAERAKQESPIVREFLDSARRNGYDPLLAEAMVSVEKVVYCVQDSEGHRRFVDEAEYKNLTADGRWKPAADLPNPVDGPTSLLTVSTDEAIKLGLAKGHAVSAEALASERGYHVVADLSPGAGDAIITFLSYPLVRMILLTIFLQSLFIGLHAPGHGAAEAVAVVSLGLLIGVPLLTGYATWWEVVIIFLGLALVAFEIFVFPGHMVSAVIGVLMVLFGLILTFVGDAWSVPGSWKMPATWTGLVHGLYAVTGALFCSLLLSMWLRRYLPRLPYFGGLILTATSGGPATRAGTPDAQQAPADQWPFVGTVGRAVSDLKPGGSAAFPYADDTRVTAVVSEGGYVLAGTKVVAREVRGNRVVVRTVAEQG